MSRQNPLFEASPLPYQAPPFDLIEDEDYQVALGEGMARQRMEVEAIASSADDPTFANTIEALERAGTLLARVSSIFAEIAHSNANATLQRIEAEEAPRLAAHHDAIYLDGRLFARVKAVYERRQALGLEGEALRLVERRYRDFLHAGAALGDADKRTLAELNQEHARLTTLFRERLLAATNASAIVVDAANELDGLPADQVAAAAECARERGMPGRFVLTLQNTTQQPPLTYLRDRDLRQRLLLASSNRAHGGRDDCTAIVLALAALRARRARLLGFSSFAALTLEDEMAQTPARALKLLTDLLPAATARAREESARLQRVADSVDGGRPIDAHDWQYFAEQVRRVDYALDQSDVRPFFELDRVLRDGVFFAATSLYGITFHERHDLPVHHPDVRVYEVLEEDGTGLGLFYTDFFARPEKRGGAWSHSFVDQSRLLGTRPVVVNVLNLVKPAPGDPALLRFDEVETLFHEFGHAVHALFDKTTYPTLSASVPRDFVEFPSQINEHWALDPEVLARYARHYRTGEPMPEELHAKIKRLGTFNQGFATTEYLAAALLDHAWHTLAPDGIPTDVDAFETESLERFGAHVPAVPPRYRSAYFMHIWALGYASTYYAYIWAEVLDQDAYRWFQDHGGLSRVNGQRFRELVLSRGDTEDGVTMFRALCGRDPAIEPMLASRGLL
jgi:peptidyl-dipeptidase Dcp